MKKVISIGEALIDFIPHEKNCLLKEVSSFERVCGGAPTNVCAVVSKLGGSSKIITKLGTDAFGDYIIDTLNNVNVDTSCILRTDKANTCLAFVSLKDDGNRDFSFYRNPSADMLLDKNELQSSWFDDIGVLHFCSVALVESPMKYAHIEAIKIAKQKDAIISFDPNVRLPLWKNHDECRKTINEYLQYADLLKISDEEVEFITGLDIEKASKKLLSGNIKIILYSMGKDGAMIITKNGSVKVPPVDVKAIDTTGAGDSIIGAFLYCLSKDGITPKDLENLSLKKIEEYLKFSNYYSSYSILGKGAINSYATLDQIEDFISQHENR
ncbi:MAG: carbohydrate kinase [Ruminococcus sp.]|nr:carbohydrate kinase [Ruminococcus sp.]